MLNKFFILFLTIFILNGCVETVVVGTVATGIIVASDGGALDLTQASKLKSAVKKEFRDSEESEQYKNIKVDTFDGKILLTGYVNDNIYKKKAYEKAKSVREDQEVIDEVMIFGVNYKPGAISDSFISSQISLKMKATNGIKSGNYEYNVVDGKVFIIGKPETKEEMEKVTDLISRVKGVKKVISYITITNAS